MNAGRTVVHYLVNFPGGRLQPTRKPGVRAPELPVKASAAGDVALIAGDNLQHFMSLLLQGSNGLPDMAPIAGWGVEPHARVGCQVTDSHRNISSSCEG